MSRRRRTAWWEGLAVAAILTAAFFAFRWIEGYRASVWAAEFRRVGLPAPVAEAPR